MSEDRDTSPAELSSRAAKVFEERNKAFRILYDTVMEVEGASEDDVYLILCRNLRRLCAARWATFSEYNATSSTLIFRAVDWSGRQPDQQSSCHNHRSVGEVTPSMFERYSNKQVRKCDYHRECILQRLAGPFPGHMSDEEFVPHCLSCIREGTLIAVAKVALPAGTRLKLKDIVDTYMNMAGMILQRIQAMRTVRESEEKYRDVVERANDGIIIVQECSLVFANSRFAEITGKAVGDVVKAPVQQFFLQKEFDKILEHCLSHDTDGRANAVLETVVMHSSGERVHVELSAGKITYHDQPAGLLIIRDITERKRAEEESRLKKREMERLNAELTVLSKSDPLTGIANRRAWEDAVNREQERYDRHECVYSIVMIDIDYFKVYNDSQGHQKGDECLRQVAQTIASSCRTVDLAGRYGGEEFAILAPDTPIETGLKFAERVRKAVWELALPHPSSPIAARVTISVGVASVTSGSWEDVLKRADDALYVAKKAGRNMVYGGSQAMLVPQVDKQERRAKVDEVSDIRNADTVAIVADADQASMVTCTQCLRLKGYQVEGIKSGERLLSRVRTSPPDVVILGDSLSDMNGLDCLKHLKANSEFSDIPVVSIYDDVDGRQVIEALQAGAEECMAKPVRPMELALRVRSIARRNQARRDLLHSYEVRGEHVRVLSCLIEFCRAVSGAKCLEQVLDHTISAITELVQCRRVSILLPEADTGRLRVHRSVGIDSRVVEELAVEIEAPISGQVFSTGHPVLINTTADFAAAPEHGDNKLFGSTPLYSAPLGTASRLLGVINLAERIGGFPFAQHELGHLELITSVASATIHDLSNREARDRASESMMIALVRMAEHRDNDTGLHLDRVTGYCEILAHDLRHTPEFADHIDDVFIQNLLRSAPLHDIGKVAIPDQILLHPGKLSDRKMETMRTHSTIGAQTISILVDRVPGAGFLTMAVDIAHYHHEWYDGSGYPEGLEGDAIPIAARILALADVYDALVTKRVYKDEVSHQEAIEIIRNSAGTQFDPRIVDAFLRNQGAFDKIRVQRASMDGVIASSS